MMVESAGKAEFEMPYSKYRYFTSGPTFRKAKSELIKAGFICEVENGANTRTPNRYRFISTWKRPPP